MAPHKIGNRPPFVKVSTNLKRHMFDTGLNIPYTHILCWWNLRPGKEWSILCESTAGNGKLVPLRQMSEFVFCQVSICVFCQAGIDVFCLIDLSDIIRGSSRHANLSPHTPSPCDVFARPLIPCQDGNRVGRVIMIIVTLTICPLSCCSSIIPKSYFECWSSWIGRAKANISALFDIIFLPKKYLPAVLSVAGQIEAIR